MNVDYTMWMWCFYHLDEDTADDDMMLKPVCNEKITPGGCCTFTMIYHREIKPATTFYNIVRRENNSN